MTPLSHLERLVAAIEHQGANIAPTYQEYMPIAFAIANDCGEAGRSFFHRICRLSEKYVYEEADQLYDHALKTGNGRNGLGSVFHWAKIAGVKTDKQLADTFRQYPRENERASSKAPTKETVPSFPSSPSHPHTRAYVRTRGLATRFSELSVAPVHQADDRLRELHRPARRTPAGSIHRARGHLEQAGTGVIRTKIHVSMPANLHRSASRLRKRGLDMGQAPGRAHSCGDDVPLQRADEELQGGEKPLGLPRQETL